jgi:nucleotide-binding universal stress UspA family protein
VCDVSIGTILVHLAGVERDALMLRYATTLARQHDSRLLGVHVAPAPDMPASVIGRGASAAYLAESAEDIAERTRYSVESFGAAAHEAGVSAECRVLEGEEGELLPPLARLADLVVTQDPRTDGIGDVTGESVLATLLREAASPVLLIPGKTVQLWPPERVLVAWDGSKEAARALRDGVPMLRRAEKVVVFTAGEAIPRDDRILDYLDGHGIAAERVIAPLQDRHAGGAILEMAQTCGADLVVMGAYGRRALAELILGGATVAVLRALDRPVLFSH